MWDRYFVTIFLKNFSLTKIASFRGKKAGNFKYIATKMADSEFRIKIKNKKIESETDHSK